MLKSEAKKLGTTAQNIEERGMLIANERAYVRICFNYASSIGKEFCLTFYGGSLW